MAEHVKRDLIDKGKFEAMVRMQMTDEELEQFFGITSGQLYKWVKKTYHVKSPLTQIKKLRMEGKVAFLSRQFTLAKTNPTIAIWIGKNYFGQTDEAESGNKDEIEDLTPLADLLKMGDGKDGDGND